MWVGGKNIKGAIAREVNVPIMSLHFIHIEACHATLHGERVIHLDIGDCWDHNRETDILGWVPLAHLPNWVTPCGTGG